MKTPAVVLYLEDVLGELAHYCENIEVTWQGQVRPPKGCSCVSCHFAAGIDKMLTAEWEERCGRNSKAMVLEPSSNSKGT